MRNAIRSRTRLPVADDSAYPISSDATANKACVTRSDAALWLNAVVISGCVESTQLAARKRQKAGAISSFFREHRPPRQHNGDSPLSSPIASGRRG